jgi:hypothetical protein
VDVGEMQRKLSQWAKGDPTKRFVDLYSLLCNEEGGGPHETPPTHMHIMPQS